jgi:hypothetical protein
MQTTVQLYGKPVQLTLSETALDALTRRIWPLVVEMELIFGGMVTKRVRFCKSRLGLLAVPINKDLQVAFRASFQQDSCGLGGTEEGEHLTLPKPRRYVPDWCRIDFVGGHWQGMFGYDRTLRAA